ncbi:hypothetical protein BpHYR1_052846 [Brachionus plicatilis]|uniref:Uncharacterized protein n=1 Tax=Brachionus plicatilis TaxID=10195 RepID=A0A3M7RJC8_BRAPC|nr:hypothetical protein BpHYR1_052846 [Brachionus plicatilis]
MSLRITYMDKRFNNPRSLRHYKPIYMPNTSNESIYVRPSKHVSRRSQSPFRKYEECIKQKMASTSPKCESLERKKSDIVGQNHDNKEEQTIFYKNKYFLNLSPKTRPPVEKKIQPQEQNDVLCSNCMTKINKDKENVKIFETLKIEEPLGTPDPEEKILDFFDDSSFDIHLDPEKAEQFMNLLIAEDELLRKKIANGQMDEKTIKRLERLSELRKKYCDFKKSKRKIVEIPIIHEKSQPNEWKISPPRQFSNANISKISSKPMRKKVDFGLNKIKSLSDPNFSLELSKHPLVRE